MTFAVIMKMISRTNTTSTSGTTLISARTEGLPNRRPRLPPSPNENATYFLTYLLNSLTTEIPFREILKLDCKVFHASPYFFYATPKHVVEDSRWYGGCKANRGG